jgi:hypothetical protein
MTTEEVATALREKIFAEEALNLYAVLDGASVPGLLEKLYGLEPEYSCLYRGELSPDLESVAPHLVRLDPDAEFTYWLTEEGWGEHWGVFAAADADLLTVRRHFRNLLRVYDSNNQPLLFRYYDPRVLRVFLPTCNAGELASMFGPVASYLLEDEAGALLRFHFEGGQLQKSRKVLEGA